MSLNLNRLQLAGNITRDPELRFTPKGMAVAKFGLAVNRRWKSETGEKKEECTFIDCDCFGKTAENIAQYFKKGSPIYIEGRLKLDQWDDKQTGQKRQKLGVVAESFQFLDSRKDDGGQRAPAQPQAPAQGGHGDAAEDDTVPF
jgi:single-strand DNA-binding protein